MHFSPKIMMILLGLVLIGGGLLLWSTGDPWSSIDLGMLQVFTGAYLASIGGVAAFWSLRSPHRFWVALGLMVLAIVSVFVPAFVPEKLLVMVTMASRALSNDYCT